MLVRPLAALALTVVCLVSLLGAECAAPACARAAAATWGPSGGDVLAKRLAAKQADRDGYLPTLARSIAATLEEIEPNDTAALAQSAGVGDVVAGAVAIGDVDWFLISAPAGDHLTISTSPREASATDTVLEAFAADGLTRLAIDDDGGMGLFSAIEHLQVPGEGAVLVRLTRFGPLGDDLYALSIEAGQAPPPVPSNDTPSTARELELCNTALTATTIGASSAVAGIACVQFDPLGGDVFFALDLPYSYQLTAQVTPLSGWDPSIYLFTDPSDPAGSCLLGTDEAFAAETETVIYTNEDETSASLRVYVGVDSWESGQAGSFELLLNCDFVVSNDNESWGALKARFER